MKRSACKIIAALMAVLLVSLSLASCDTPFFRPMTDLPETADSDSATVTPATSDDTDAFVTQPADTTEPPPETTVPPEPVVLRASFLGAGDVLTYYGNVRDARSCAVEGGRTYNFKPTYSEVADRIAAADIAFVNQETLMCGEGYALSYYPYFNSPQDLGCDLAEIGFDVVNIANNHMLDKGADGLAATIDFWNSVEGVTLIGGYKNDADYENIRVVETNGIRVAFLSYATFTNYLTLPSSSELVVPLPDEETVHTQVARARELADFVIVSVHWGDEGSFSPNQSQRDLAETLAELGVDVIVGHHPHVIQPVEWIEREDGGRTLCVYSLGNFVAEQNRDYNMLGGMITFDMVLTDGVPSVENVEFIPTVYYYNLSFYQNRVYYYTDFTEALAASHGLPYYGRTLTLSALTKYLKNTISPEFMPGVTFANEG